MHWNLKFQVSRYFKTYTDDMTKIAEMVYGVTNEVTRLGCSMIAEEWESYDELLRKRKDLRQGGAGTLSEERGYQETPHKYRNALDHIRL